MRLRPIHNLSIAVAIATLLAAGGAAAGQTRAAAQPQVLVHFPGISGTSSAPAGKGGGQEWIELISVSDIRPARAVHTQDVILVKFVDKASPVFMEAFKRGTRFQTVRVAERTRSGKPQVYLKYGDRRGLPFRTRPANGGAPARGQTLVAAASRGTLFVQARSGGSRPDPDLRLRSTGHRRGTAR